MPCERFSLFHTTYGETIAKIEMNDDLLNPEAGIVDPETLTLRSIKGGGMYTLIPIEDHTVTTLRRVYEAYRSIKEKPCQLFSVMIGRTDNLIDAVALLFGEIEYIVVESADDIDRIINHRAGDEYEPKKVKHSILGDMLTKVLDLPSEKTTNDI